MVAKKRLLVQCLILVACVLAMILIYLYFNQSSEREKQLIILQSQPITFTEEGFLVCRPDSDNADSVRNRYGAHRYCFIVFVDSTQCSTCRLSTLNEWGLFLKRDSTMLANDVGLAPIFSPSRDTRSMFVRSATLYAKQMQIAIYIDTAGVFRTLNPHLPEDKVLHTFLIDQKGDVILAGNPLGNPKLQELIVTELEKRE